VLHDYWRYRRRRGQMTDGTGDVWIGTCYHCNVQLIHLTSRNQYVRKGATIGYLWAIIRFPPSPLLGAAAKSAAAKILCLAVSALWYSGTMLFLRPSPSRRQFAHHRLLRADYSGPRYDHNAGEYNIALD